MLETIRETLVPVRNYFEINRLKKAYRKVVGKKPAANPSSPKILFHLIRTIPASPLTHLESIIYHGVRVRGAQPKMVFCGSFFDNCDAEDLASKPQSIHCRRCRSQRDRFVDVLGVDALFYKDFVTPEKAEQIRKLARAKSKAELLDWEYEGVNVGHATRETLIRYYQSPIIPDHDEASKKIYDYSIRGALLVEIAKNIYEKERPDALLTLHGVYTAWEPFYMYMLSRGVTSYTYIFCFGEAHGLRFVRNGRESQSVGPKTWNEIKNRDLREDEKGAFEKFLDDRFNFKSGWVTTIKNTMQDEESKDRVLEFFRRDDRKCFALFTNIPWDSALIQGDRMFKDTLEWIDETIEFFKKNDSVKLVIKVHPAEILDPKSYSLTRYIVNKHPKLPENIFLLPADTKLKPYDMFDLIDAGLVYAGTVGLEMAMLGYPVLLAGHTHYAEFSGDVVFPLETKEDYFNAIRNPDGVKQFAKDNKEQAYKYAYTFFLKSELAMPFFEKDQISVFDQSSLERIEQIVCEDPTIDRLCTQMIAGEEVSRP